MHFLLDTNVLISAEPTRPGDVEARTPAVIELLRALSEGHHRISLHPASITEASGDKDEERRNIRLLLFGKYSQLAEPPALSARLTSVIGTPKPGTHNAVDLLLLSAVDADAVDYLITEDDGIHRRARRCSLRDRVLTISEALATVRALFPTVPFPPPRVSAILAHSLREDPIFGSFRVDYEGFDEWLKKCKREQRQTWVVETDERYAGVCIVNEDAFPSQGPVGKTLKICTFKIAESYRGFRYGELLLKTVFAYAVQNRFVKIFVEVFPKHYSLLDLFADFGFEDVGESKKKERVLLKSLQPSAADVADLSPIEVNIKYGPHAIRLAGARVFVVPIQPRFHRLLFPECEPQLALQIESHPFGNSIRKAYLSNSSLRKIKQGDVLLFYCSQTPQAITAIGVAEDTAVSNDPHLIARYVGKRTVYPFPEIERMAAAPILAILFRLSRALADPWTLGEISQAGIVRAPPQSIAEVRKQEAIKWIANRLDALY
ncbi:GNAT family N-acetyltransferase [Polyangium aurulentum]|uniref:GNAT family N-acetyltransferase n=1 Tax=Polyangium aurulentum TaxID=2567896 RepID=UPI0010AEC2DB|nr:GNAT family N-acetyltransferase [Polyangium aurulentum]UQA62561.1 GNAT family N-acetyltransferase [Polyangium aurulentum]